MTDRTPDNHNPAHALRVLEGGYSPEQALQDEAAAQVARARLAEEIAEAARLCDRLEADGLRIAFDLDGASHGVRVSVRDDQGHDRGRLAAGDLKNLRSLAGLSGETA